MKTREVQKETRDAVCDSISTVMGVDILDGKRKRELVNGRMVYYALLRDMNYSWTSIARSIDKHHATIIPHIDHLKILYRTTESCSRITIW